MVHAKEVAARLTSAGVPSACVEGTTKPRDRQALIDRFKAGDLQVLTNCMCLTEGFDAPMIEVCILARGADHAGLYIQMVGRALRPFPGKDRARVYDLKGVAHVHGLPDQDRVYSLTGKAIDTVEKLPALMTCPCGAVYRPAPNCPVCGREKRMPEPPEVIVRVRDDGRRCR